MAKGNAERRKRRVVGLALVVVGVLALLLLGQYYWRAASRSAGAPAQLGSIGGAVAGRLSAALGVLSFLLPGALILLGAGVLSRRGRRRLALETALLIGTGVLLGGFLHALPGLPAASRALLGGSIGGALHTAAVGLLGAQAGFVLLAGALLLVVVALFDFEAPGGPHVAALARGASGFVARLARRGAGSDARRAADARDARAKVPPRVAGAPEASPRASRTERDAPPRSLPGEDAAPARAAAPRVTIVEPRAGVARAASAPATPGAPAARGAALPAVPGTPAAKGYTLPPLSLLQDTTDSGIAVSKEELLENSRTLESKLADFGVGASVVEVHPGPVITRYELQPAPGIKVGQIVNLADDLALAMRAKRIRIVAPIPGKGAVGIEIPNAEARTVALKEVLGDAAFRDAASPLSIGLGKDTSGNAFVTTLEEMPHLLIAGATGSGKSVAMHVLISSILFKAPPSVARFLMIDPKMLELTVYNDIPHLMRPVITDPRVAAKGLRWVIEEMERRYKTLARVGVRNIGEFNRWLDKNARRDWGDETPPAPLPFLVVVIDEYADLVLTLGAEVEEPIAKLAQMARAVGIHLVVATQRPSVDVITGVIKANFPSRIAFQVASKVDSRTIMDVNGAEKLLGRGDMLFLKTGRPEPERVHGAFISNDETAAIVEFIKEQRIVVERLEIEGAIGAEGERPFNGNAEDELFEEAVKLVVRHQLASVSMLQRRFKIGFSRAGRLMDLMEQSGIVGPFEGSKSREVLVKPSEFAGVEGERDE
jgi:S-DNA-T family DNA segregation ATPase FtsK/SpoIIIE